MEETTTIIIVNLMLGIAGIVLMGWSIHFIVKALESRKWPTTDGEIINSLIVINDSINTTRKYEAVVLYKYIVADTEYSSKRLSYGSNVMTSFRRFVEKEALQYQPGMKVRVYYDPEMPEESVLISGADLRLYLVLLFGVIFFSVAVTLYIITFQLEAI